MLRGKRQEHCLPTTIGEMNNSAAIRADTIIARKLSRTALIHVNIMYTITCVEYLAKQIDIGSGSVVAADGFGEDWSQLVEDVVVATLFVEWQESTILNIEETLGAVVVQSEAMT